MVYSNRHSRPLHFEVGLCGMEIAILLLLTVPFTATVPITSTQSADSAASDDFVQLSAAERPEATEQVQYAPALKIIPFLTDDNQQIKDTLKHKYKMIPIMSLRLRPRRAPQRGCQLGTCQLHNLANTLYHISKTNGKDESKKANDPQGYGR